MKSTTRQEIKALHTISPVLWAVVKGFGTEAEIAERLKWSKQRTQTHTQRALKKGLIKYWDDRLIPTNVRHKQLRYMVSRFEERKANR